jgi:hypothetical protein
MAVYNLYKWSVSVDPYNGYTAPEARRAYLIGFRNDEKKPVATSYIKKVEGRRITTESGSVYILEDIDPIYSKWLKDDGYLPDEDSPLSFVRIH